jgi:hypothetical protein
LKRHHPNRRRAILAAGARDDQQRGCEQDRDRQSNRYQSDRCLQHAPVANPVVAPCVDTNSKSRKPSDQVGSGIAIATLIDSIASAITTDSDKAPIVTRVAVALASRDGTAGTVRLSKPAEPGDHVMVQILACGDESLALSGRRIRNRRGQYCGGGDSKNGKITA